jgi:hypothetical protein
LRLVLRLAGLALLGAALVAVGMLAVAKQVRDGNDFPLYWQAARDLLAGRTPYVVGSGLHGFVYLPWFAWALAPLAILPLPVAAWCWYAANVFFTFRAARSLRASLHLAGLVPGTRLLLVAALPLAGLAHDNLVLGQANLCLLWLVATAVRASLGARGARAATAAVPPRSRALASGLALGFAAALKMTAAILVLPLAIRGRARTVAAFVAGAALAIAIPFLTSGRPGALQHLDDWRVKVVVPAAAGILQGSKVIDQSPHAALRRLLVDHPAYGETRVNVASLAPAAFARVSRTLTAALLAVHLLIWLTGPARGSPRALLLDLSLAACAMVQVTGFSLKAQFIVLLLPAWVAATLAWGGAASMPGSGSWRGAPHGVRALLLLAGALFLGSYPDLVGRALSNRMLAWSSLASGTMLLVVALAWLRYRVAGEAGDATPSPTAARSAAPGTGTAP